MKITKRHLLVAIDERIYGRIASKSTALERLGDFIAWLEPSSAAVLESGAMARTVAAVLDKSGVPTLRYCASGLHAGNVLRGRGARTVTVGRWSETHAENVTLQDGGASCFVVCASKMVQRSPGAALALTFRYALLSPEVSALSALAHNSKIAAIACTVFP